MSAVSSNGIRRLVVGGILAAIGLPVGLFGFMVYAASDSHNDYDRVAACLQQHCLAVTDGWKHTDGVLEDFGLIFEVSDGQPWEVQILDGSSVRNCRDRISGLFLSNNAIGSSNKKYLALDHPVLIEDLYGANIQTLGDSSAQLEWLIAWAQAHPNALLTYDEVDSSKRYVSLLSPPL